MVIVYFSITYSNWKKDILVHISINISFLLFKIYNIDNAVVINCN